MSTARTCTTTEDGWALFHHFLGNQLLVITMQCWEVNEEGQKVIDDARAQLVGNLYMIMRRMSINGHEGASVKMQQILNMVVEQDLTNQEVRKAIHAKEAELRGS